MTTAAEAETAPAKVNLALHVTGRRADGYHLIDSLVVFAGPCDSLHLAPADDLRLSVRGPFADEVPAGDDNLVLRAAAMLAPGRGAAITLEKNLPAAAGLGGGSADAAATLRALARLWSVPLGEPASYAALGADVPVCLVGRPARMRGIGEIVEPVELPCPLHIVLVNPRVPLSTASVFAALDRRDNPGLAPLPRCDTPAALAAYAARQRNDLEPPAVAAAPVIAEVLAAIRTTPGCLLARMSGSGATCFGLYADAVAGAAAKARLAAAHPGWWVAS
jgi:4-diphosphocytidyl-2-C-methyl-D-erythritol kinase